MVIIQSFMVGFRKSRKDGLLFGFVVRCLLDIQLLSTTNLFHSCFKLAFASWDYVISNAQSAMKRKAQNRFNIKVEVKEIKRSQLELMKTNQQKCLR